MRNNRVAVLAFAMISTTAFAADLSSYREFRFGADLPTVAKLIGASAAQATTIIRSPAILQQLDWRPQPLGWSAKKDAAETIRFSFYDGELFRIVVDYDTQETEGLTVDDVVEAISAIYGEAARPVAAAPAAQDTYSDEHPDVLVARWQDPQYRFDLVRSSYGEGFRLIGVRRRLEAPARVATLEAKRVAEQEAPQREADRLANEEEAAKARLQKARTANKPAFRP